MELRTRPAGSELKAYSYANVATTKEVSMQAEPEPDQRPTLHPALDTAATKAFFSPPRTLPIDAPDGSDWWRCAAALHRPRTGDKGFLYGLLKSCNA
uniref:Uncharacterized protein n=1 Tax=Oryza punctata TaxID=4537 RepID=A0A0E0JGU9_ORYPU